ncbi:MAG TPA: hypothetical protein DEV81_06990 [Cyanobacteria bacterium UBA11049]|nr:hypothetical protein [Cyanobacteria bacterium UBA11049]
MTVQMDELPSFVSNQGNKQWVWLVLDAETHEIVGVHIGDRSSASAQALWQSMPAVRSPMCRDRSVIAGQPMSRSYPASGITQSVKKLGKRATQSRFNCTLRQRVSQLVRKTLSFSKKLDDRIGAIWNFYHRYNASLPPTTSFPL